VAEARPEGIVARLGELDAALAAWVHEHRGAALAAHEQGVLALVRRALPGLLAEVVRLGTPGLGGRHGPLRERCPGCGARARTVGWRPRAVLTVCGPVGLERAWYACRACRRGWSPADATLAVAPRARVSAGVRAHVWHDWAAMVRRKSMVMPTTVSGAIASPEQPEAGGGEEGGLRPPRVNPLAGVLRSLRSLRPPRR